MHNKKKKWAQDIHKFLKLYFYTLSNVSKKNEPQDFIAFSPKHFFLTEQCLMIYTNVLL